VVVSFIACCSRGLEGLGRKGRERTGDETWEEWLLGQIGVVLLEVLLCCDKGLDCYELEATLLEASDDIADESTLKRISLVFVLFFLNHLGMLWVCVYLDTIWLDGNEAS
jgi:hypothetical protein